jgi:hypothetical protein
MHVNTNTIKREISEHKIQVLLWKTVIGEIRSESGGYRFYPEPSENPLFGGEPGEWCETLEACKRPFRQAFSLWKF